MASNRMAALQMHTDMIAALKRMYKRMPARSRVLRPELSLVIAVFAGVLAAGLLTEAGARQSPPPAQIDSMEKLGEALFFDTNLSMNRTQACATCHSPDHAFTDPRDSGGAGRAVSIGDDGHSMGDRNTPSATYARLTPDFHINAQGKPVGGLFWDGRAKTLADQAMGPPLNPIEMGMPDKRTAVERLKENAAYVSAFDSFFGKDTLSDDDKAYAALGTAIAAFEHTTQFSPFDSKYDRYLRGEVQLTEKEELGRVLFFSTQFTNCSRCHKLKDFGGAEGETFTNYQYRNIGTPVNTSVRALNGSKPGYVDTGLAQNPSAAHLANVGMFKIPSLRNVAVTAPYMHNGVFKDLRTVVKFYNKYNSKNPRHQINPETGEKWGPPEIPDMLAKEELEAGSALDSKRIDGIVAFLKTLTDKRYEHLLEK